MFYFIKDCTLLYLRHVGGRREDYILSFVCKRIGRGCTEELVVKALHELRDEGEIEAYFDIGWVYITKCERARRAVAARRGRKS